METNRIAIYLTAVGDLVAALAPFIFDFGGSEKVAAYTASILGINAVVVAWLRGWQQYEARLPVEVPGEPPLAPHEAAEGAPIVNPDAPQQPRR